MKSDINRFLEIQWEKQSSFCEMFENQWREMLTAAAGSLVSQLCLILLRFLMNYILPQLKNKTTVGNVTGKITLLNRVFS